MTVEVERAQDTTKTDRLVARSIEWNVRSALRSAFYSELVLVWSASAVGFGSGRVLPVAS